MKKLLKSIFILSIIVSLASCVNEDDTSLPSIRIPFLFQNFESENTGVIAIPEWSNVSMNGGSTKWEVRTYSSEKYAQLSSYGTGETNMDTWLITKSIDLAEKEAPTLKFSYKAAHYNGQAISVLISTDYDGSNTAQAINAATWTNLNVSLPDYSQNAYPTNFSLSDAISLSEYQGKVYIAFRYVGSSATGGVSTTYQIDNINVYENK